MALVTVDEAILHLRATNQITSTPDRDQVQWLCTVASGAVEDDLKLVLEQRTITTTFDGGCYELRLQAPPRAADGGSITITEVLENDVEVDSGGYVLRKPGWRLLRGSSTSRIPWASGWENISVTYVAGCADPPVSTRMVALYVVQSMWQSTQQAPHPLLDESGAVVALAATALAGMPDPLRNAYNNLRSLLAA